MSPGFSFSRLLSHTYIYIRIQCASARVFPSLASLLVVLFSCTSAILSSRDSWAVKKSSSPPPARAASLFYCLLFPDFSGPSYTPSSLLCFLLESFSLRGSTAKATRGAVFSVSLCLSLRQLFVCSVVSYRQLMAARVYTHRCIRGCIWIECKFLSRCVYGDFTARLATLCSRRRRLRMQEKRVVEWAGRVYV